MIRQEGIVFLPMPDGSALRSVRVWCSALQGMTEVKGTVQPRCGLEVLQPKHCVHQTLGCVCLRSALKRGYCLVGKELQAGKW